MEMVHVAPNGDYERYESLTLQKEQLEKDADQYYISYVKEFGELTTTAFEVKIECIALKKEIALYVAAKNNGRKITQEEIDIYLREHMTAYREELNRMLKEKEAAKHTTPASSYTVAQVKTIYRRLAKMLHPDISPLTEKYPNLSELFNRVIIAYKYNDLKELQKLEVLINKELEENGIDNFSMVIPDISERIEELEKDIDAIVSSEPYTYKNLLEDEDAVADKKKQLQEEIDSYNQYKAELTEKLKEIKDGE